MTERTITAGTHGRYLTIPASDSEARQLLVGFHGYAEDGETQLERLRTIPGSARWTLLSIQGLHVFYNRRLDHVVASWMTRQNRQAAIADNIAYVGACIDSVEAETGAFSRVVFAGFSQGVAMAFRAAAYSTRPVAGVIAVGGDVPPDVTREGLEKISAVLIARGQSDPLYSEEQFRRDEARLQECSVDVRAVTLGAGHEWSSDLAGHASQFLQEC